MAALYKQGPGRQSEKFFWFLQRYRDGQQNDLPFFNPHKQKNLLKHNLTTIIIRMDLSKTEMKTMKTDLKKSKKARRYKLIRWLLVDLAVVALVFAILLYRPGRYKPADSSNFEEGEVSPYLTNELSPAIYNGAQRAKPYDVIITQDGLNDIIARGNWPMESEGVLLYAPAALFVPGRLVLMGTADAKGVEFVVTIELEPKIDEEGLLNLQLAKLKVGAMNITPLAKIVAKKMYMQRISDIEVDTNTLQTKIVASLLTDEPFDPVFIIDDKKVRIEKITIENEKLSAHLVPAS
jgi:uncharacterized protein YpmS